LLPHVHAFPSTIPATTSRAAVRPPATVVGRAPRAQPVLRTAGSAAILTRMSARAKLAWLTVWSLAFGLVEGAVVTYLRRLVYGGQPLDGPLFPLRVFAAPVLATELAREPATLVMLAGVAAVAERRFERRFAAFAFCFALWDLGYYAMLKLAIGWPRSVLE